MRLTLALICLTLCLAAPAAAQPEGANVNAAAPPNANAQPAGGAGADAPDADGGVVGRDARAGDTIRVEVSTKAGQGGGGGIDQWWKDFFDIASKLLTFVSVLLTFGSVILAVLVAREQFRKNRQDRDDELARRREEADRNRQQREDDLSRYEAENQRNREQREYELKQREDELRWKKAELARVMLGELFHDRYAENALMMLDWNEREFLVAAYEGDLAARRERINWDEMWAALRIIERDFNEKERFIRDCFDALFNHMRGIEHYIAIGLIDIDDVTYPFDYYLRHLDRNRSAFDRFTESYHPRAKQFIERLEAWLVKKQAPQEAQAAGEAEAAREGEAAPATAASSAAGEQTNAAPEPAYFLFDCRPREDRYVFMLEERHAVEEARAVLDGEMDYYLSGNLVERPAYYNGSWQFHVEPSSVSFANESPEFVEAVCVLTARQKGESETGCAASGGRARLLAELPARWFAGEREKWEREQADARARPGAGD